MGTSQPAQAQIRDTSKPTASTLVTGSAYTGTADGELTGAFRFTQGEVASRLVTFPDPGNVAGQAPVTCSQYQRSYGTLVSPQDNDYTVTIFGTTAAFDNLRVFKTDRDGKAVGASIGLTPLPAGSARIPSGMKGAQFAIRVPAGTAESENFSYKSAKPGSISVYIEGNVSGAVTAPSAAVALGSKDQPSARTNILPRIRFREAQGTTTRAGDCSAAITVQAVDGAGSPIAVEAGSGNNVKLALTGAPADIFLDPACTYPTTNMSIANPVPAASAPGTKPQLIMSSQLATFYVKSTQAQSFPVTATHVRSDNSAVQPSNRASQLQAIVGQAPLAMELKGPSAVNQGECSPAITLRLIDRYGNEAGATAAKRLNVGAGSARFYGDAACTITLGSSLNVGAGASNLTFFLRDNSPGGIKLMVTDPAPTGQALQAATHPIRILGNSSAVMTEDPAIAKRLALRIYDRVVGLPGALDDPKIKQMADLLLAGKAMEAAHIATDQDGFYNVTLRNLATSLSNRLFNPMEPLNDFVTTWIGTVRDGRSATELLTGNHVYVGDTLRTPNDQQCASSTVYKSNSHFNTLASSFANLRAKLVPVRQCAYNNDNFGSDSPVLLNDSAGLLTTRTWGVNHLFAGTNRRAIEFAFDVFLCRKIRDLADNTMPDWHIRRDVDRAPGGDPKIFGASCRSCHGGLDSLAGAWAFFDAYSDNNNMDDFRLFYVNKGGYGADAVMRKLNQNASVYPPGWITGDDSWSNFFTENQNQSLGWGDDSKMAGNGIHEVGEMLSKSAAFPACMARRVFKSVCKRDPYVAELPVMDELSQDFQASGHNMRRLFEKAATLSTCLGNGTEQ